MKKIILIAFLNSILFTVSSAQNTAEIIKFRKLDGLIKESGDQVKVINFWATWCGPCIKELPYFEAAKKNYRDQISVHLISLDFADQIAKVNKFVERKGMASEVYLLDEIDYNSWIDKVDQSWSGAIPATLVINEKTGERKFVESEITEEELYGLIESFID
ncbi:MAG: TlpA disulfide reductase family protein [Bacteroidota bacterium]